MSSPRSAACVPALLCFALGAASCSLMTSVDDLSRGGGPSLGAGGTAGAEPDSSVGPDGAGGGAVQDSGADKQAEGSPADVACPTGNKFCGTCLPLNDPNTGCSASTCDPCNLSNASSLCANGGCAIEKCMKGFEDCNGIAGDGCEANLDSSLDNCGKCGQPCGYPHTMPSCQGGICLPGPCESGYDSCDQDPSNGCEVHIAEDPANCGTCGHVCPDVAGKTTKCVSGDCVYSNCEAPWEDCDKNTGETCETNLDTSSENCGGCGHKCAFPYASAACIGGACALAYCLDGRGNCDGVQANGCETDTTFSLTDCGACDHPCAAPDHSTASCVSSKCKYECQDGWGDCNSDSSDGCEQDTNSSVDHCGMCYNPCPGGPGADGVCEGGVCGLACQSGYADCDLSTLTGCETNLNNSSTNCGSCGHDCCGGQCLNGVCQPRKINVDSNVYGIAEQGDYLYVTLKTSGLGRVQRIRKSNGNATLLLTFTGPDNPTNIVTDGSYVYFAADAGVYRLPSSGASSATKLASGSEIWGVALDDQYVYATDASQGRVIRVPKTGGSTTTLVSGQTLPRGIAVSSAPSLLFVTSEGLKRMGTDGSGLTTLYVELAGGTHVAVDSDSVAWANTTTGTVWDGLFAGGWRFR